MIALLSAQESINSETQPPESSPTESIPTESQREEIQEDPFAPVDLSKFEVKENEPVPGMGDGPSIELPIAGSSDPFRPMDDKEISQSELSLEELARQEQKEIEELKDQRRTDVLKNAVEKNLRAKEACKKSLEECLREETLERKDELLKD